MPASALGPAYLEMIDEHFASGEEYGFNNVVLAREDFTAFVRELEDEAAGIGLPPGIAPQQTYLLVEDGATVIGEIRFRPSLEPPYERQNGHISYNIRPSRRGKGYATQQLALLLNEARKLHLPGVSLTIDGDNPASVRVIEKNGGVLIREIDNPLAIRVLEENGQRSTREVERMGEKVALYWIDLTS